MTPADTQPNAQLPWKRIAWFGVLLAVAYAPVLASLLQQWYNDEDMSHGFFVPIVAGWIIWKTREDLMATPSGTDRRGLILVGWGAIQMWLGTLAVELFLTRTSFVITLIGAVWFLCGVQVLKKLAFPLFLCFFMVPIPAVIYNSITFPLQLLASRLAENALSLLSVPVLREGNVLILPDQELSVVEACSGIRSLLSLTFLSLVYGYFFESRSWVRVVLFFSTIPIAIVANGSRVTLTGILSQVKPELAEGAFHAASGWVIFMVAMIILVLWHRALSGIVKLAGGRKNVANPA
jgi:exosortase